MGIRETRIVVGRSAGCDIVLDDSEVSRKHLLLSFDGETWWATDLESKNGTWLDGRKVQVVRLKASLVLKVGNTALTLLG
jgi:pSer/pThr/pTyr-binding forkhead associated (FHA) protein